MLVERSAAVDSERVGLRKRAAAPAGVESSARSSSRHQHHSSGAATWADPMVPSSDSESLCSGDAKKPRFSSSTFVEKLVDLCTTPDYQSAIGYSHTTLEIRDANRLAPILLHFFKHSNVSSFIRQLNNYGFKSLSTPLDGIQRFVNTNFVIGDPELLSNITRKGNRATKRFKAELIQKFSNSGGEMKDQSRVRELEAAVKLLRERCDQFQAENDQLRAAISAMPRRSGPSYPPIPQPFITYGPSSSDSEDTSDMTSSEDEEDEVLRIVKMPIANGTNHLPVTENERTSYLLLDQDDYVFDLLGSSA